MAMSGETLALVIYLELPVIDAPERFAHPQQQLEEPVSLALAKLQPTGDMKNIREPEKNPKQEQEIHNPSMNEVRPKMTKKRKKGF